MKQDTFFLSFAEFSGGRATLTEQQVKNISLLPAAENMNFYSFCD